MGLGFLSMVLDEIVGWGYLEGRWQLKRRRDRYGLGARMESCRGATLLKWEKCVFKMPDLR